jgi:hypothetical protein
MPKKLKKKQGFAKKRSNMKGLVATQHIGGKASGNIGNGPMSRAAKKKKR